MKPLSSAPSRSVSTQCFTLIESLVVVATIAILVALTLPAMHLVRRAGVSSSSLSRLRQHAMVFQTYSQDYDDSMPRFLEADGSHEPWSDPADPLPDLAGFPYFSQAVTWPVPMQRRYYADFVWSAEIFHPPWARWMDGKTDEDLPYQYAATSFSRPSFWIEAERTGPGQWLAVRTSETSFPALKAMVSARAPHERGGRSAHIAWIDGSAAQVRLQDVEPGYPGGEGPYDGAWTIQSDWPVGSHTRRGVRGRDVTSRGNP